jgi:hypothetical protein
MEEEPRDSEEEKNLTVAERTHTNESVNKSREIQIFTDLAFQTVSSRAQCLHNEKRSHWQAGTKSAVRQHSVRSESKESKGRNSKERGTFKVDDG